MCTYIAIIITSSMSPIWYSDLFHVKVDYCFSSALFTTPAFQSRWNKDVSEEKYLDTKNEEPTDFSPLVQMRQPALVIPSHGVVIRTMDFYIHHKKYVLKNWGLAFWSLRVRSMCGTVLLVARAELEWPIFKNVHCFLCSKLYVTSHLDGMPYSPVSIVWIVVCVKYFEISLTFHYFGYCWHLLHVARDIWLHLNNYSEQSFVGLGSVDTKIFSCVIIVLVSRPVISNPLLMNVLYIS